MKQKKWNKNIMRFLLVAGLFMMIRPIAAMASEPYEKIASTQEWDVLKSVNKERVKEGQQAISMFASIQKAADVRSKELISLFSHSRPDGKSCFTALDAQNVKYMSAGENIAAGQKNSTEVMYAWMQSAGHRANILSGNFQHIGIGYVEGGFYGYNWTQLFVGGCSVSSVEINSAGTSGVAPGTSIDSMNRYLIVTCKEHGTSYVPVVSEMCSGYEPQKTGEQTVTVKYQNQKVKMKVSITGGGQDNAPATVTGVKVAKRTTSFIQLKWNKKAGSGYEIWRSTSKNGTYKKLKNISKSSTTRCKISSLKHGVKYYFKIRAYRTMNGKKVYGAFSAIRSATTL